MYDTLKRQAQSLREYQRRAEDARKQLQEEEEFREELFEEKLLLEKRFNDLSEEMQRVQEEKLLGITVNRTPSGKIKKEKA